MTEGEAPRTLTERKRAAILRAAAEAFRHEGYLSTSTDRIAEKAGVSKRTLYNHFPSKEALFDAVIEGYWSRLRALGEPHGHGELPVRERLASFARKRLAILLEPEVLGIFRTVLRESLRAPDLSRALRRDAGYEQLLGIVTVLEEEVARGRLVAQDVALASTHFWGLLFDGLFWPAVMHLQDPPTEARLEHVVQEGLSTFLARYGAPSAKNEETTSTAPSRASRGAKR